MTDQTSLERLKEALAKRNAAAICAAVNCVDALIAVADVAQEAVKNDEAWKRYSLGQKPPESDLVFIEKMRKALANLDRVITEALG